METTHIQRSYQSCGFVSLDAPFAVVSTLLNFVRMFVRAHEENCKQLEFEKKKAEKEAENEKMKLGTPKKDSQHFLRAPLRSGNIN